MRWDTVRDPTPFLYYGENGRGLPGGGGGGHSPDLVTCCRGGDMLKVTQRAACRNAPTNIFAVETGERNIHSLWPCMTHCFCMNK